jgi:hypothetical protein
MSALELLVWVPGRSEGTPLRRVDVLRSILIDLSLTAGWIGLQLGGWL